jgi:tetratricopeptide (TPR) repeat protein
MFFFGLSSRFRKLAASVVFVGLAFLYGWMVMRSFAASQLAEDADAPERLQRALALAPGNAEYLTLLGRHYYRQGAREDKDKALARYYQALQHNPFDAWCWYQLSYLYLARGDTAAAERALRTAERLNPQSASLAWATGNFWLDQGKVVAAMDRFRTALEHNPELDTAVFEICWDVKLDPAAILGNVIPNRPPLLLTYLSFLIENEKVAAATETWHKLVRLAQPLGSSQAFDSIGLYADFLIRHQEPAQAGLAWRQFFELWSGNPLPFSKENLIYNGSFEEEISNRGFDWRITESEHARIRTDTGFAQNGHRSLYITFDGKENLEFNNIYQLVPVEPNTRYFFSGFVRTEHITSDQGPRFEIRDYYAPDRWHVATNGLVGSNDWLEQTLEFTTGPDTRLVALHIARTPSERLANLIQGKVWIDNIRLTRL